MGARPRARLLAALSLSLLLPALSSCDGECAGTTATVLAPDGSARLEVCAEVARTEAERKQGLLGRDSLPPDEGLVIWFPLEGEACITGAGMAFAIDTVFAAESGGVVAVERFAEGDAKVVCHDGVRAVLEVGSGVAAGVATGDSLELDPRLR